MKFSAVIGQKEIKQQLIEMVQHNRLSHALLFRGKEGSGALPLAIAFAQYLVCEKISPQPRAKAPQTMTSLFGDEPAENLQPVNLSDSCGTCSGCIKSEQLIHPDIHFSYPVVTKKAGTPPVSTDYINEWRSFIKKTPYGNVYDWLQAINAENKQGNITANECNDIIRKLNLKSFESEYKVLILWMAEYLGAEGNKLLKLIEEPPANTLFILITENENLILPTIVSRCQLIKIPSLSASDVEEVLIQNNKVSPAAARQIAGISDGNYREALQLVENSEENWEALLRDWLNAIMKTGPVAQTKWVEEASRLGREKQKQFLRYFNHLLETSIRLRIMGENAINESERDFAERLNRIAGIEQQRSIIEELDKASYYIERNANSKILFHALTIKLYHIIQDKIVFLNT